MLQRLTSMACLVGEAKMMIGSGNNLVEVGDMKWGGFRKCGVPLWVHVTDYPILGSILGSPCFGKLPNGPGKTPCIIGSNPRAKQTRAGRQVGSRV